MITHVGKYRHFCVIFILKNVFELKQGEYLRVNKIKHCYMLCQKLIFIPWVKRKRYMPSARNHGEDR